MVNTWLWLGITFFLLIIELLTNSGFLLWIALSAGLTSLLALFILDFSLIKQAGFFSLCSISSCILWWFYLKRRPIKKAAPIILNRRAEQYIGRVVNLVEPIVNGQGRVHMDDSFWRVQGEDLPQGAAVKIVAIEGIILKVEPYYDVK